MTLVFKPLAGVLCAFLWLSGCATGSSNAPVNLEEGLTGETPNHPVVTVSKVVHVLHFRDGSNEPDANSITDLNSFLATANAASGAVVLIERSGAPSEDDRTAILSGALARNGLKPTVRVAAIPSGELRLTMESYLASAPGCPNWSKTPGNDFANTLPSDFGCATATNLAAMVADPRDLIAGTNLGPAAGDPAVAPLQRYRAGKLAPLTEDGATSSAPHGSAPAGGPGQ